MLNFVPLTLEWFPKNNDYLIGKETFCIEIELALNLIGISKDYDPIIAYGYKVSQEIAEKIQKYYKHRINFDKFDYIVCSYSNIICPQDRVTHDS